MAVVQYGENLAYGISDNAKQTISVGGVTIYPTSVSVSKEGEVKEYRGPAGTGISLVIPEGLVPKSSGTNLTSIKKGDVCTITGLSISLANGGTYRLESFSIQWSNEDAAKVSATIKQYPDITK